MYIIILKCVQNEFKRTHLRFIYLPDVSLTRDVFGNGPQVISEPDENVHRVTFPCHFLSFIGDYQEQLGKDFAIGCIGWACVPARRRCIRSSQSVCFHTLTCSRISGWLSSKVATPARLPEHRLWDPLMWDFRGQGGQSERCFSLLFRALMDFSVRAVMLETSGSIAGQWSIIAATTAVRIE